MDETRLEEVFQEAADRSGREREEFLDKACAGDPALRREVEKLLDCMDKPSALLEEPLLETRSDAVAEGLPGRLGEYRILRELGSGSSGRVYEAQQASPQRRVALKVLKESWVDHRVERRFQREIEILGLLEHPGICRIYEAGKAELIDKDGASLGPRLFFAMELVEGKPVTHFAKEKGLDIPSRLGLLRSLAEAVADAHERGVLHRDLKPANILVAEESTKSPDSQTTPNRGLVRCKVLDFGIGRVLGEDSPERSRLTLDGAVFGTPAYMSPEQFSGDLGRVDTRCDVWALGVLGYELLSGVHPFLREGESPFQIQGRILREDPIPLGKRIKGLDPDVETTIHKALEKDPEQRYPTAWGFAEDLRRIHRNEPILGRPPSLLYQIDRWARRHKALAAGLGVGLLGLVLGLVFSLYAASLARNQRDRVLKAQQDLKEVNAFFNNELIRVADPDRAQGKIPNVHQLLESMAASLGDRFAKRPLVEASIRAALGKTWLALGKGQKAHPQLQRAAELFQKAGSPNSQESLENLSTLATWLNRSKKSEEALALDQEILNRARNHLGKNHELALSLLGDIALTLQDLGRFDQAKDKLLEIIHIRERLLGKEHPETLIAWNNYAFFLYRIGKPREAEVIDRRLLKIRTEKLGPKHPNRLTSLGNLALDLLRQGKAKEALPFAQEAQKLREEVFGRGHPSWLKSSNILALILKALSKTGQAKRIVSLAYQTALEKQGPKHPDTLRLMNSLSILCRETGEIDRAVTLAEDSWKKAMDLYPKNHWILAIHEQTYAEAIFAQGQKAQGIQHLQNALQIFVKALGTEHLHSKRASRILETMKKG